MEEIEIKSFIEYHEYVSRFAENGEGTRYFFREYVMLNFS